VILNCHGLGTEALFTKKIGDLEPLDIKIIACCDKDPKLRRLLKKHSTAKSFGDMRDFVNAVLQDPNLKEHLMSPDILFTTAPCQGRSVLREENGIDPKAKYSEDDLFFLQLVLIQLLKPRRVISEMTPPNAHFHADHYSIALEMERLGYEVTVTDRFPSDLCGDIQHRERWIMIGRLRSRRKLRPLRMTDNLPQYWKSHNWYHTIAHIFPDPQPYPAEQTQPEQHTYSGCTNVSNYENAELAMLLERLQNEFLQQALKDRYLVIGPTTTRDVMSNPIVAKVYTMIYNITRRSSQARTHDTYLIDLYGENKALKGCYKAVDGHLGPGQATTFQVGHFSSGLLPGSVNALSQEIQVKKNICQKMMPLSNTSFTQSKHQDLCFNIVTLKSVSDVSSEETHARLTDYTNYFAPNTVVAESDGLLAFLDPSFTLDSKNLSRSAYLGHLFEGKCKGFKVYSRHRPCPTFTSYANVLIKDDRSLRKGVRLLSRTEMLRLNNFPPEIIKFLEGSTQAEANRYIANSIPTNMLHNIYKSVIADLDSECEGVPESGGAVQGTGRMLNLFNLSQVKRSSRKGSAHNVGAYVMHQLLSSPLERNLDIDVRKLKAFPQVQAKSQEIQKDS